MKAKFKIDLKKLETGEPVWIDKNLYAKKLADSIEIYEIKPGEITSEDKESISDAVKALDKLHETCLEVLDPIYEKLVPMVHLNRSLIGKYCEDCLNEGRCEEIECELSKLTYHPMSDFSDLFEFPEEEEEEDELR